MIVVVGKVLLFLSKVLSVNSQHIIDKVRLLSFFYCCVVDLCIYKTRVKKSNLLPFFCLLLFSHLSVEVFCRGGVFKVSYTNERKG